MFREMGTVGIEFYTQIKTVHLDGQQRKQTFGVV